MSDTPKPDTTTHALAYAVVGSLGGINAPLAKALSARLDDEWILALRSAGSNGGTSYKDNQAYTRLMFEKAVTYAIEAIANDFR